MRFGIRTQIDLKPIEPQASAHLFNVELNLN
jgi:hypothetical protein